MKCDVNGRRCETMAAQLADRCEQHGVDCPDKVVVAAGANGRLLLRSPNAHYALVFCPWCGGVPQPPEPPDDEASPC